MGYYCKHIHEGVTNPQVCGSVLRKSIISKATKERFRAFLAIIIPLVVMLGLGMVLLYIKRLVS